MAKFKMIIPLLMLIVGTYLVPIGILESDFSKIPGDLGDARFNNYILEHGHQFLKGEVDSYWEAPFMFPYKKSITFSDNLLGSLPIYSAWRFLGFDRETAFQWWILTIFIFNFLAALWVLQKWSQNYILASVGAYIFAFSIMLVGNIYNVQTLPRFILPFLFYWLWRFLKEEKTKYFVGLALGLVYQFYCGIYLGFLALYVLAFFTISLLLVSKDFRISMQTLTSKKFIIEILLTAFVSIFALGVLMYPYYVHSQTYGLRSLSEVMNTVPMLQSYFFTNSSSYTWGGLLGDHGKTINSWWCHFLFIGILPWIAVLGSTILVFRKNFIKTKKGKALLIFLLALILSICFSIRIGDYSLYYLVCKLPGFSAMRSVNRIINTELFLFILVLIFFFKELSNITKYGKYIVYILPVLVIFDNLVSPSELKRFDKSETQERVSSVRNSIFNQKDRGSEAIAYLRFNKGEGRRDIIFTNLDVMLASQDLKVPCVNAYSGSFPDGLWPFLANMDIVTLNNWLSKRDFNVEKISLINEAGLKIKDMREVNLSFNNKFICRENSLNLYANREVASMWEKFSLIEFKDGTCALRTFQNKFVSSQHNNNGELLADSEELSSLELFNIIDLGNGFVAFSSQNNKYWNVNPETFQVMTMSDSIGDNETFKIHGLD